MDDFDFFPEIKKTVPEPQIEYDSEEDALDAAVSEKQNNVIFENTPDPADPAACRETIPVPVPDPCNASHAAEFFEKEENTSKNKLSLKELRRIAFAFLATKAPDAAGMAIPSGISGYMLDAASIKLTSRRNGGEISDSTVVIAAESLTSCLMPEKKKLRLEAEKDELLKKKADWETQARVCEPYLNESLFMDEPDWHYEKTSNRAYHRCLRKLEKTEFILNHSGKLDRLMAEQIANQYYVIVPDTVTDYSSIPDEWGILSVAPAHKITVIREAKQMTVKAEHSKSLAAMIACQTWKDSLFANGIAVKNGETLFSATPRRRAVKFRG